MKLIQIVLPLTALLLLCISFQHVVVAAADAGTEDAAGEKEYTQDESTKAFVTWFRDMGGKSTGVTVGVSATMGRGVFATKTLKQEFLVLSVLRSKENW